KKEIELLFVERGERFPHRADNDAAKTDLFQEELEKILQALVVIDHEHGRLARFVLFEDILIEGSFLDAPTPADLNRRQLATLNEIVNGWQRYAQVFGRFLDRKEIMHS